MKVKAEDCIESIREASGKTITSEQAEQLLDQFARTAKRNKLRLGAEKAEKLIAEQAQTMSLQQDLAAKEKKLDAARNLVIKKQVLDKVKRGEFKDAVDGFRSYLLGTNKNRASVAISAKSYIAGFQSSLARNLQKKGLLTDFASGTIDREIYIEMGNIKADGNKIDPNVKTSLKAQQIAELVWEHQKAIKDKLNRAGAKIGSLDGYIHKQVHDMDKIRRMGKNAWVKMIEPLLDHDRTFGNAEATPAEFLGGAYDALVSGVHLKPPGSEGPALFEGSKNLARLVSEERTLHFKNGESVYQYNQVAGNSNLRESILRSFDQGGRNLALLEGLGSRPQAMMNDILKTLKSEDRTNLGLMDKFKTSDWMFKAAMSELDGSVNIPGNGMFARWASNARGWMNFTKLGGSAISSISDIANLAGEMHFQGIPLMESYQKSIVGLFEGKSAADRKELAESLGILADSSSRDLMMRFAVHEDFSGKMAKWQQTFFTLNGQNFLTDRLRSSAADLMSNNLAKNAGQGFNEIPAELSRVLKLYDINEAKWDLFRNTKFEGDEGHHFLDPTAVQHLDEELIKEAMGKENIRISKNSIAQYRDKTENAFRSYLVDRADYAVPNPDAGDRIYTHFGLQKGTIPGEAMRFFAQYKSFSITAINKVLGRELYSRGPAQSFGSAVKNVVYNGQGAILGMANLIAGTFATGYLAMVAKDIFKGREPRQLWVDGKPHAATIIGAMAQGGGLGIFGDFLFGEFSRQNRTFTATMAGPFLAQLDDVMDLYTSFKKGEDFGAKMQRLALNNTPMLNLFYTRAALDYLILYQLQEAMSPGSLQRMEKKMENNSGQHFFVPPSSVVPRGGGEYPGQGAVNLLDKATE